MGAGAQDPGGWARGEHSGAVGTWAPFSFAQHSLLPQASTGRDSWVSLANRRRSVQGLQHTQESPESGYMGRCGRHGVGGSGGSGRHTLFWPHPPDCLQFGFHHRTPRQNSGVLLCFPARSPNHQSPCHFLLRHVSRAGKEFISSRHVWNSVYFLPNSISTCSLVAPGSLCRWQHGPDDWDVTGPPKKQSAVEVCARGHPAPPSRLRSSLSARLGLGPEPCSGWAVGTSGQVFPVSQPLSPLSPSETFELGWQVLCRRPPPPPPGPSPLVANRQLSQPPALDNAYWHKDKTHFFLSCLPEMPLSQNETSLEKINYFS